MNGTPVSAVKTNPPTSGAIAFIALTVAVERPNAAPTCPSRALRLIRLLSSGRNTAPLSATGNKNITSQITPSQPPSPAAPAGR